MLSDFLLVSNLSSDQVPMAADSTGWERVIGRETFKPAARQPLLTEAFKDVCVSEINYIKIIVLVM